jgi:hypothetical protein
MLACQSVVQSFYGSVTEILQTPEGLNLLSHPPHFKRHYPWAS